MWVLVVTLDIVFVFWGGQVALTLYPWEQRYCYRWWWTSASCCLLPLLVGRQFASTEVGGAFGYIDIDDFTVFPPGFVLERSSEGSSTDRPWH